MKSGDTRAEKKKKNGNIILALVPKLQTGPIDRACRFNTQQQQMCVQHYSQSIYKIVSYISEKQIFHIKRANDATYQIIFFTSDVSKNNVLLKPKTNRKEIVGSLQKLLVLQYIAYMYIVYSLRGSLLYTSVNYAYQAQTNQSSLSLMCCVIRLLHMCVPQQ